MISSQSKKDAGLKTATGRLHHTETFGTVDGPGVRFVVFMQGCPLKCLYCHNPQSLAIKGQNIKHRTAGSLVKEILRYKSYLSGGVTFSGGEPLLQHKFVEACEILLKEHSISSAIDTAGLPRPDDAAGAIEEAELILLDIKAATPELALRLTGQDNSRGEATLKYCEKIGKKVWVRHVLLPGFTLDESLLNKLARSLLAYKCIEKIELLPFHKLGEPKWEGMEYLLYDTPAASLDDIKFAKEIFVKQGFNYEILA